MQYSERASETMRILAVIGDYPPDSTHILLNYTGFIKFLNLGMHWAYFSTKEILPEFKIFLYKCKNLLSLGIANNNLTFQQHKELLPVYDEMHSLTDIYIFEYDLQDNHEFQKLQHQCQKIASRYCKNEYVRPLLL